MSQSIAERRARNTEAARKYRAAHPDRVLASVRKWRAANRERALEITRAWNRQWREANPELHRELCRRWADANPLRQRANEAKYRERNRERVKSLRAKRRALKAAATVEHVDRVAVFERDGYVCQICGGATTGVWPDPMSPSLDHIVALSKGGEHSYANTQCAHHICNARKGTA